MNNLEAIIKRKFTHLSNAQLVKRINNAPDFGWDDEGYELERRMKASNGSFDCKINGDVLEIIKDETVTTFYFDLTAYEQAEFEMLVKKMSTNKPKYLKDIGRHNFLRNRKNLYLKQIGEREI